MFISTVHETATNTVQHANLNSASDQTQDLVGAYFTHATSYQTIIQHSLSIESSWWVARVLFDCHLNSRETLNETLPYVYVCVCVN